MSNEIIEFELPKASPSIIMVTGVGGGGSNAVNHMYNLGITDVSFMVCNTDKQALNRSCVPIKIRLGCEGLGAGNRPERGRQAAEDSLDEIKSIFAEHGTKMVFITAGMGGGTGTGAAPVIAKAAKEMDILTVAIVTIPFKTEGPKRIKQALEGIEEIKKSVDALLVVNNENIQEIYGKLTLSEAFGKADDILATAAKGIAEIITEDYYINVDFADVETVMKESGIALMGSAQGRGENRALEVTQAALSSPLLNHKDISGAKNILLNIRSGENEVTMDELYQITDYIQQRTGMKADLIWGAGQDASLGEDISVTIIATGFDIRNTPFFYEGEAIDPENKEPILLDSDSAVSAESGTSESSESIGLDGNEKIADKNLAPDAMIAEHPAKSSSVTPENSTVRVGVEDSLPLPSGENSEQRSVRDSRNFGTQGSVVLPDSSKVTARFVPSVSPATSRPSPRPGVTTSGVVPSPSLEVDELQIDLEEWERTPAYIRRKMKLSSERPQSDSKPSKIAFREDAAGELEPTRVATSLFDTVE